MSTDDRGPERTDDAARDLLPAYALDAVDDVERRAVERLVERDDDAARELADLRATAAALAATTATAPPGGLRDDVLAQVHRTGQIGAPAAAPAAPAAPERDRRRPSRAATWLAIAATAVGAATVPTVLAVREAQRSERVEQEARAVADLLAEPGARLVRADVAGGGTAVAVLADERALFTGTDLPDPGEGRDYQLWVVREDAALSVGVLPDDDGRARALAEEFRAGDALAVTVEPAGGSEQPTTDPVVVLAAEG